MAHVVTEACFGCKHTNCLDNCPTGAFREGQSMLFIDPDACIDCYLCASECPEGAIFQEDDVPEHMREYIELNAEMAPQCPEITEMKEPLAQG